MFRDIGQVRLLRILFTNWNIKKGHLIKNNQFDFDILQSYHYLFGFLSNVFLESPDSDFIQNIISQKLFDDWLIEPHHPSMVKGTRIMQDFFKCWNPERIDDLKLDYTRLFIGLESTLAPPYESVYLSQDHIMFDKQTLDVRLFYEKYNLRVPRKNVEPDDHIGYELHFIALLCHRIIAEFQEGRNEGADQTIVDLSNFLDRHLLLWLDAFVDRIVKHARVDYFRGIALLTQSSVECLSNTVKSL